MLLKLTSYLAWFILCVTLTLTEYCKQIFIDLIKDSSSGNFPQVGFYLSKLKWCCAVYLLYTDVEKREVMQEWLYGWRRPELDSEPLVASTMHLSVDFFSWTFSPVNVITNGLRHFNFGLYVSSEIQWTLRLENEPFTVPFALVDMWAGIIADLKKRYELDTAAGLLVVAHSARWIRFTTRKW